ncbi:MAG: hypothetical protein OXQ29_04280 [Rhodospirillaceae bacterium]|nr:hypothetical protein [Rhodospirillaceae bacterium]
MMTGRITPDREAVLDLVVAGSGRKQATLEAVIDTGFNGYLVLSSGLAHRLELQLVGNRRATLGDGHSILLEAYLGTAIWHGRERAILVLQAEGGQLIGMSLLFGSRVTLDVTDGGEVTIDPLS